MRIYAQIIGGLCVAITQAAGAIEAPGLVEVGSYDASLVGKRYDAKTRAFVAVPTVAPQPTAPAECTPAQGLVALYAIKGITDAQLDAAVAQIPDPALRYTAQIGLKRATTWRRGSATVQQMAQLVGLTDAELDALFAYAVEIEV